MVCFGLKPYCILYCLLVSLFAYLDSFWDSLFIWFVMWYFIWFHGDLLISTRSSLFRTVIRLVLFKDNAIVCSSYCGLLR